MDKSMKKKATKKAATTVPADRDTPIEYSHFYFPSPSDQQ